MFGMIIAHGELLGVRRRSYTDGTTCYLFPPTTVSIRLAAEVFMAPAQGAAVHEAWTASMLPSMHISPHALPHKSPSTLIPLS